ncbi:MAG: OmpA family protein [Elusimicrobia bacterium]|nr:OmpA family protein [Elusimicrobiota bacterium]
MSKAKNINLIIFGSAVLCLIAACAKKPVIKEAPQTAQPMEKMPEQEDIEASLRGKDFSAIADLGVIYFEYDSSELRSDMRAVVEKNAEFLKLHPSMEVRIDGHCDNRGTTEYNLGLGQRRASAIRAFYKSLGVRPGQMATQSWGKERLNCFEFTESCHNKNRRVETLVRVKEAPKPPQTDKAPAKSKKKPSVSK